MSHRCGSTDTAHLPLDCDKNMCWHDINVCVKNHCASLKNSGFAIRVRVICTPSRGQGSRPVIDGFRTFVVVVFDIYTDIDDNARDTLIVKL